VAIVSLELCVEVLLTISRIGEGMETAAIIAVLVKDINFNLKTSKIST
jgi:hypothetical protein